MVDFRKLISPKSRRKFAQRTAAISDFKDKSNVEKADVLLSKSRALIDSGLFSSDQRYSYDEWALYRVVPELALRLDPEITLRETEHPKEEERSDNITWLRGAPDDRLASAVTSILSNGSFQRGKSTEASSHVSEAADLLFGNQPNFFSVAAETIFPSVSPDVLEESKRPPLTGTYLIASMKGGHDRVLGYSEDRADLELPFSQVLAVCRGQEIEGDEQSDGAMTVRIKDRFLMGYQPSNIESISFQTYDGDILQMEKIDLQGDEVSLDL